MPKKELNGYIKAHPHKIGQPYEDNSQSNPKYQKNKK